MLRLRVLLSIVPLIAATMLAGLEAGPTTRPCIALGAKTMQIATLPWRADLHVSFTDDPALATVRVAITDDPDLADFAVVDDGNGYEASGCESTSSQLVAISSRRSPTAPVIYLSNDDGRADYRIYVHSGRLSPREAAALIVGAHDERTRLALSL